MKRDSVIIYRNLFEALQDVSDKSYKRIMNAILKYSMDGEELELTGVEKAVFQLAKTQIDANNRKYENGKKGAEFGKLGGRPKKVERYEEIMEDFGVSEMLKLTLWEFIKHCQLNGRKVTNDKLEDIIVELDKHYEETEKIRIVQDAIRGGYYDVKRCS